MGSTNTVAVAIICKTPEAGRSKTRLSPPLRPEECAEASACFIRDLAETIAAVAEADGGAVPRAVYTPAGSEARLREILPPGFELLPQRDGDFGERLGGGVADLLAAGHSGAIVINSDSPTLPRAILAAAVDAVRRGGDSVVLSPAHDGGYTLIGLSAEHPELFDAVSWSTDAVFAETLERARAIRLPVIEIDGWYDVDDAASFAMLERELDGQPPPFARFGAQPETAVHTRRFVAARRAAA